MAKNHASVAQLAIGAALSLSMVLGGTPVQLYAQEASAESQQEATKEQSASKEDTKDDNSTAGEQKSPDQKGESGNGSAESDVSAQAENPSDDEKQVDGQSENDDKAGSEDKTKDNADANETATPAAQATSSESAPTSGTWGTCQWEIDDAGTLTIHPGQADIWEPWYASDDKITAVKFVEEDGKKVVLPENMSLLFASMSELKSADFSGVDSSNTANMQMMFSNCSKLERVDGVASLDVSKVTNFSDMFWNCSNLVELDLSSWDVSSGTNFGWMFDGCGALVTLDVSSWDVSSGTDFGCMFDGCASLATLDVSSWDVSSGTNFGRMFYGCESLTSLDVSGWNVSNAESLQNMFRNCKSLELLDVSKWNPSKGKSFYGMFSGCSSLKVLDFRNWDTSSANNGDTNEVLFMLSDCDSVTQISLGKNTKPFDMPPGVAHGSGIQPFYGWWYSQTDKTWYKQFDILENRLGIEDTYTKTEDPVEVGEVPAQNGSSESPSTSGSATSGSNTSGSTTSGSTTSSSTTSSSTAMGKTNSIDVSVQIGESAPTVTSGNLSEIAPSLFTAAETARITNGESAKVWLDVQVTSKDSASYNSATQQFGDQWYKAGVGTSAIYDITLWKQVGNDSPTAITNTGDKMVAMSLKVPDDLVNKDQNVTRTFYLYRTHLDLQNPTASSFDEMAKTTDTDIPFSSNKFSYYTLGYLDESNNNGGGDPDYGGGSGGSGGTTYSGSTTKSSTSSKTSTPSTGDPSMAPLVLAAVIAGTTAVFAGVRTKQRK